MGNTALTVSAKRHKLHPEKSEWVFAQRRSAEERALAFFALALSKDIQDEIATLLKPWRQKLSLAQWVHPRDYHLTLRFLGGLPAEGLERLLYAMQDGGVDFDPFTLQLHGLQSFPPHRDRGVLWIGLQEMPAALIDLQMRLELQVQSLGFQPDHKSFTPHITVNRFKSADAPLIEEIQSAFKDRNWGAVTGDKYVLMKRRSGARDGDIKPLYEVLARFSGTEVR